MCAALAEFFLGMRYDAYFGHGLRKRVSTQQRGGEPAGGPRHRSRQVRAVGVAAAFGNLGKAEVTHQNLLRGLCQHAGLFEQRIGNSTA